MPKNTLQHITGIDDAALAYYIALQAKKSPVCFIARDDAQLARLEKEIPFFAPKTSIITFPAWDVQPYDRLAPDAALQAARAQAIGEMQKGRGQKNAKSIILTTVNAASTRLFPHPATAIELKEGQEYAPAQLGADLINLGLKRVETVTDVGEFAQRGAVFDVFPPLAENPLRLDYFDNEIESIKTFDALTQRSLERYSSATFASAGEVMLTPERIQTFRENYRDLFPNGVEDTVYTQISNSILAPLTLHYLPLFSREELPCVFDLLPETCRILAGGTFEEGVTNRNESIADAYTMRLKLLAQAEEEDPYRPLPPEQLYLTTGDWQQIQKAHHWIYLHPFDDGKYAKVKLQGHHFGSNVQERATAAVDAIMAAKKAKKSVTLTAPTVGILTQLQQVFENVSGVPESLMNQVHIKASHVAYGFESDATEGGILLVTDQDILGPRQGSSSAKTRKQSRKNAQSIAQLSDLQPGDYITHDDHGVGQFEGLVTLEVPSVTGKPVQQDFLKILYAASAGKTQDRVFVPIEALGLISRHSSVEAGTVTLDKLGGVAWQARKARIKKDLLAIAKDLMKTAAAREVLEKSPMPTPAGLYEDFANTFPFQPTPEQQSAIDAVLGDMAEEHPMDRLVVGDVGFGKTEVALRAAMVAVGNNRQVAIIAPTTLLARQHYEVFTKRFAGFPVKIAPLSRLVSSKNIKQTKQDMREGKVDIIIGTHALLAKDIAFKRLGLLVIDEEQRFGVTHKEKLKDIKANVDVLTLTATPIPRTLHMASGGLKHLSTITTPPVDRLAVRSFVLPWDPKTMREAILRELHRGGQVYIVTPRVKDIPKLEDAVKRLVPEGSIRSAHGQMPERDLEDIMDAFYQGDFQILISTTIIESGLDVPRANTMIINRADRFGLSQLHQLRGRVGRSTVRAYAYFILPEGQVSELAERRLKILQRLEGLGAGFQLANFDMDLRGAGNLLGKEQSGHVQDIGFELYTKMLTEAVRELKTLKEGEEAAPAAFTPQLNVGISYLIPNAYVPDLTSRMQLYRRLSQQETDLADITEELRERFGPLPEETEALLQVVNIRNRCHALNIDKLDIGPKGIVIRFYKNTFHQPEALMALLQSNSATIGLNPDQTVSFRKAIPSKTAARLEAVEGILSILENL